MAMVTETQRKARDRVYYRVGSVAAVGGVTAALVQTAIDPGISDHPQDAIRLAAGSHVLAWSRLLDMVAFLLLLVGVAAVTDTFAQTTARGWARAGLAMFTVSAGAGAIATMIVGSLNDVASTWSDAPARLKPGYVAVFDSMSKISGGISAVAWMALAAFGLLYAQGMLLEGTFPRWLPWISIGSAIATLGALAVGSAFQLDFAFVLLVVGIVLSYVVIVAFGVRLWRSSRRCELHDVRQPSVDTARSSTRR